MDDPLDNTEHAESSTKFWLTSFADESPWKTKDVGITPSKTSMKVK